MGQEYRVVLLGLRLFGGVQLKQILVLLRSEGDTSQLACLIRMRAREYMQVCIGGMGTEGGDSEVVESRL